MAVTYTIYLLTIDECVVRQHGSQPPVTTHRVCVERGQLAAPAPRHNSHPGDSLSATAACSHHPAAGAGAG